MQWLRIVQGRTTLCQRTTPVERNDQPRTGRACACLFSRRQSEEGSARLCSILPRLAEPHARRGFLNDKQVTALSNSCASVGLWLRSMLEVARLYGCRAGELKQLRVGQVDISAGTVNLEQTKNGEDRVIVMAPTSTVKALLKQCTSGKSSTDYVFTRTTVSR